MPTTKKAKGVRLFKAVKEFNVAIGTLVETLEDKGFVLEGKLATGDPNGKLTPEMYDILKVVYSDDAEAAARVEAKRQQREAQARAEEGGGEPAASPIQEDATVEPEPVAEAPVVEAPVEEPPAETSAAETPAIEAQAAEVPAAEVPAAEVPAAEVPAAEVQAEEPSAIGTPEESQDAVVEVATPEALGDPDESAADADAGDGVAEASMSEADAEADQPVAEAADVQPTSTSELEADAAAKVDEPSDVDPEAELADGATESGDVGTDPDAEVEGEGKLDGELDEQGVLRADRFELTGTKVIGKIDLSSMDLGRSRRKRKRKGGTEASSDDRNAKSASTKSKSKKRGKRGPVVNEEEVESNLQETLNQIQQGASRARQKRRRERRDQRAAEREAAEARMEEEQSLLRLMEFISTGELADLMGVPVNEVIQKGFSNGLMISINQRLDADTIVLLADEFDMDVEFLSDLDEVDVDIEEDSEEDLLGRSPVVTIMGHVDHGKTSLLDYIRSANVVAGEAGGITQHIGAYKVDVGEVGDGREIAFLDTPGHEAFTAMRARGAQVTDIVILVVAADDEVMPQTIEAISHARAAGVPLVVALNKIDKPDANPDRILQQLSDQNVLVEQYGGSVQCEYVSAITGEGVDTLLERVLIEAELLDLKANPDREALGTIIESRLDKGRGVVSTVLVQNGTLRTGDAYVAGTNSGRVRAMFNERDQRVEIAGPSTPVLVLGWDGQPDVGDRFLVREDEREARDIASKRQQLQREQAMHQSKHVSLAELSRRMALGQLTSLNLIIKGDVGGSVEALADSLMKIQSDEVVVDIIHTGVGAISESDVMLAAASDAIILGFQVRPMANARLAAEREEIDIRTYSVIYDAIQDVRDALEGLLSPEEKEIVLGSVEIRETFRIPKVGTIAGCYVLDGKIRRSDRVRLVRDGVVVYTGNIGSLKRFKDDVREVAAGYECGLNIDGFNDIKVGDQIEVFEIVEEKRQLAV
ncbi:MAG: translation initiation factor IF-2 [Bacteroidota bacterium]